jgi:hypothetical protein
MARYYFNFRSARNVVIDENGLDFIDVRAARDEAMASVREDYANASKAGCTHPPYSTMITDASGREVATITAEDILQSQQPMRPARR